MFKLYIKNILIGSFMTLIDAVKRAYELGETTFKVKNF